MTQDMSIIRHSYQEYVSIPLPGAEGVAVKVLKVDEDMDRATLMIRFAPGSSMPRHIHHCRAMAYTVSGGWAYDEGSFGPGDIAWEDAGNDHTPYSDEGAELFLVFDGLNGRYLDNILPCGTVIQLDMPFLKAYEGVSQAEADEINVEELVTIIAPTAQAS